MKGYESAEAPARNLRRRAGELVATRSAGASPVPAADVVRALHELRVHQIELEAQNEELRRTQAELEATRSRYFELYDLAPVGYCTLSAQGLILDANLTATTLLGVPRGKLVGRFLSNFIFESDLDTYHRHHSQVVPGGMPQVFELRMKQAQGVLLWTRIEAAAAEVQGHPVSRMVLSDITRRKAEEEALRASEARFRGLFDHMAEGLALCRMLFKNGVPHDFVYLSVNAAFAQLTDLHGVVGRKVSDVIPGVLESDPQLIATYGRVVQTGKPEKFEVFVEALKMWFSISAYRLEADCFAAVFDVITERKRVEEALHLALEQKSSLIKEIHHRVKNNLAIMVSLINLQARRMRQPDALAALADTKARLFSMALLHEMLYRSGQMDRVDARDYLKHLSKHLTQSYGLAAQGLAIESRAPTALALEPDHAVPCGLIVNELVSNAVKHAFPNGRQGKLRVELAVAAAEQILLRVADNGIGLPESLQPAATGSMGLTLVNALTRQLGGTLEIRRGHGTEFAIRFPLRPTTQ